jgi:hypothetical protein
LVALKSARRLAISQVALADAPLSLKMGRLSSSLFFVKSKEQPKRGITFWYIRFPIFGGWQTQFYIGYNVPTEDMLTLDSANNRYNLEFGEFVNRVTLCWDHFIFINAFYLVNISINEFFYAIYLTYIFFMYVYIYTQRLFHNIWESFYWRYGD